MALPIRSPDEIDAIARSGAVVRQAINAAIEVCSTGATTAQLDEAAADVLARAGSTGVKGTIDRPGRSAFPGHICVNVNEEAAHAAPGPRRLRDGDIVVIDIAACIDGWWADAAEPVVVGAEQLGPAELEGDRAWRVRSGAISVWRAGLAALGPGVPWREVAAAIRRALGDLSLVKGLDAHGVGREMHEPPSLAYEPTVDLMLRPGMVFTLEPTVTDGDGSTLDLDDGWTVATQDRGWCAFRESTVAIVREGVRVLTGESPPETGGHGRRTCL